MATLDDMLASSPLERALSALLLGQPLKEDDAEGRERLVAIGSARPGSIWWCEDDGHVPPKAGDLSSRGHAPGHCIVCNEPCEPVVPSDGVP